MSVTERRYGVQEAQRTNVVTMALWLPVLLTSPIHPPGNGKVELMLTKVPVSCDWLPPPSTASPEGQSAWVAVSWPAGLESSAPDRYSYVTFEKLNLAHTAKGVNVASLEEKLLTVMPQVSSLWGHELFKFTSVLLELLSSPPPVRRSLLGQVTVVPDWNPAGFGSAADICCT